VVVALLVPIVPFLGFGDALDQRISNWLDPPPSPAVIAAGTVGVLSLDVLLPVPSSLVSTIAGAQLGIVVGTAITWLGMTFGALLGFGLARLLGRPLAERFSDAEDLSRMDRLAATHGAWILVMTRALPVLAEAAVLVLGTTLLDWRRFLPPVVLSNLGIAAVYAVLGHYARQQEALPLALAASIAVPVLATGVVRWLLPPGFSSPQSQ
jgi:uncharacterized membrane protein YdjX (TVP38/TMEM64 family)